MHRQLLRMLVCLLAFLALVAVINLVVNPYGAWPVRLVDTTFQKVEVGMERMETPYRVRTEQPTTVLLGTSRVLYGMWIDQGYRADVLNAALPGQSLDEAVALIDLALRNPRLRRIIWSVELIQFTEQMRGFRDAPTQTRLLGDTLLRVRETLLSADALQASGGLLLRRTAGRSSLPAERTLPIPWPPATLRAAFDEIETAPNGGGDSTGLDQHIRLWLKDYGHSRLAEGQWDLFTRTIDRIRAAGIDLTLLAPPLNAFELETIRQGGQWPAFQAWKGRLATVSPYWDFSGYHELALRDELFTFPIFCHFKPAVGHALLRRLLEGSCDDCGTTEHLIADAGVWVDSNTVQAHLEDLDAARLRVTRERPRSVQAVERIVDPATARHDIQEAKGTTGGTVPHR